MRISIKCVDVYILCWLLILVVQFCLKIVEGNKETQGLVSAVDNHVSQLVIVVSSLHYKCNIPKDRVNFSILNIYIYQNHSNPIYLEG